ncbi:Nif3-like dinuclear metal center hexameric protein [Uruburuella testudinis]|uniref:Nif3-like dinuclear metal center hexameric protein n=1 Tax=Uruburuella testudinis TaxID=1282863 RepID=A0ABY4DTE3_9NEIS|nr:Nif3-like dinuclear metal center hexameric protein [Uruburuella testudinis]UOO81673.1 Nif3-like dinuclear metal center hexameric protein [Uruburuella testudinis]
MTTRRQIIEWCDHTLQTHLFKDYAPNGLQVEGGNEVRKIITAVTASRAAIDYAAKQGADMLLVHHGMFWKSEPVTITGWKKQRIATLLQHQINLAGYHLPLDAHPELGNNARLAKIMGWQSDYQCGEQNLLNIGRPEQVETLSYWAGELLHKLGRAPVIVGDDAVEIKKIAWCTGGAQSFFQTAIDEGVDAFVTGEISEAQYHLANETAVAFISAGHHATERYGIQALGVAAAHEFGIEVQFFDEQNPA